MSFQAVTPLPSELGESPFWHPVERQLYWVDIPGRKIMRSKADGGSAAQSWAMPSEPGCMAPAAKGGLVIALRDGIYRADAWGAELRLLHRFAYDSRITRFNDGKADGLGRFWAGTLCEVRTSPAAELFVLDCRDGRTPEARRMAGNATVANGLAWSPDNRIVYWSDTQTQTIRAWDWEAESNTMSNERVFQRFAPKPEGWASGMPGYGGRPDGAAVDTLGNYYAAMFEGGQLLKFAPTGELVASIPTPVLCPTMPCFGGDDLRTLYLTTSREKRPAAELASMPQSGCVFSMRVDTPGLAVNFFRD
jgi:sugar lactone lactonase YvrE